MSPSARTVAAGSRARAFRKPSGRGRPSGVTASASGPERLVGGVADQPARIRADGRCAAEHAALHVDRVRARQLVQARAARPGRRRAGPWRGSSPGGLRDAEGLAPPRARRPARRRSASRRSRCRSRMPFSPPATPNETSSPAGTPRRAQTPTRAVRKPARFARALLGRGRAGCYPVSVHAMLRTVSLTLRGRLVRGRGLEPGVDAAVLAARVVTRAVRLPLDVLEQRVVGGEDAVGEQVAGALPAVRVARDRAPRRARELPVAGEEVLVDRAREPAVAVLADGACGSRGTSPRARRASSSAPGRSASTGSRARSASRRSRCRSSGSPSSRSRPRPRSP